MKSAENPNSLFDAIVAKLTEDDDRDFWRAALNVLADEFLHRLEKEAKNREWVFIVGACSHWVRPHQTRWKASGGFAWPQGYESFRPELDWSVMFSLRNGRWMHIKKSSGKARASLRVAIPSRTARNKQAAIHTKWSTSPEPVFYGFRNLDGLWTCVAASDEKLRGRISLA